MNPRSQNTKESVRRHVKAKRQYRPRVAKFGMASRVRELPVDISSSSRGAQQSGPARSRLRRQFNPTSAGGVVAANDSRATTCSSSAGPGQPKVKSYRRTSGWPASGTGERRLSDCSSRIKERPGRITVPAVHEGRKGDHATPPRGRGRVGGAG